MEQDTYSQDRAPPTRGAFKKVAMGKRSKTSAWREQHTRRLVEGISPANRVTVEHYVAAKRATGLRVSTLMHIAQALVQLDMHANGTPFDKMSEEELRMVVDAVSRRYSPATTNSYAAQWRGFYRWANDDELPRAARRGLKRRPQSYMRDVQEVSQAEFTALLETSANRVQRTVAAFQAAYLWTLWDSGFRHSELLSLRVKDFQPDQRGGAKLRLVERPGVDLKTGPRTVYVVDCVGAIKVWLALHRYGTDPEAPLWPSDKDPTTAPWPCNLNAMLGRLCKRAGVRHVYPHLFRHTRATRAARAGWNEPQMRAYFGWSPGSEMPSHYIHLAQRDMEERVRRDSGIDGLGNRVGMADEAALDAMLRRGLKRLLLEDS